MMRMILTRVAKNIFETKPGGKRIVMKPRLRRLEDVENDF
jgi:hypothetical protein